jgi:hypothetical protein
MQDWAFLAIAHGIRGDLATSLSWSNKVRDWITEQDRRLLIGEPVDPRDTPENRLELEILLREADEKVRQIVEPPGSGTD